VGAQANRLCHTSVLLVSATAALACAADRDTFAASSLRVASASMVVAWSEGGGGARKKVPQSAGSKPPQGGQRLQGERGGEREACTPWGLKAPASHIHLGENPIKWYRPLTISCLDLQVTLSPRHASKARSKSSTVCLSVRMDCCVHRGREAHEDAQGQ
jgi:hypothetical protein